MSVPAERISLQKFLESVAPLQTRQVEVMVTERSNSRGVLKLPSIQLYCNGSDCLGTRWFDPTDSTCYVHLSSDRYEYPEFVLYECRNCDKVSKLYALKLEFTRADRTLSVRKVGEDPGFGEPRPDAVVDVLADELDFFNKGYRAECNGLGIGAFAYYRRFVDSHKDKILGQIRKVAVTQNAPPDIIAGLDRAARTSSFKRAVEEMKEGIPPILLLKGGHNPLTLLYTALSEGVHEDDDEECLERAQDVRTVLTELAARTKQALEDSKAVDAAVKRLLQRKTGSP